MGGGWWWVCLGVERFEWDVMWGVWDEGGGEYGLVWEGEGGVWWCCCCCWGEEVEGEWGGGGEGEREWYGKCYGGGVKGWLRGCGDGGVWYWLGDVV